MARVLLRHSKVIVSVSWQDNTRLSICSYLYTPSFLEIICYLDISFLKILILDEATASIDSETDALVRESLNQAFEHSTVLIIAHRLSTVLNSDKVLVMDNGQVISVCFYLSLFLFWL